MEQFTVREYIVREMGFPGVLKQEIVGEIVRCEDCKHHDDETPGAVYCPYQIGGWVNADFFCAGGERRDNDRNG